MIPADDGIYSGISDLEYHADHGSLSSSGARTLLAPSCPAIFRHQQDEPPAPKPQFDMGHVCHTLVLGEGSDIVIAPFENWKTKESQQMRDKAHANGKVPILSKDFAAAQAMADVVRTHPVARQLFDADGQAELSGYWHDENTGVRLRFRTDWLCQISGRIVAVDYKTSTSADPAHFAKAAADFGYHMQDAWYRKGLAGAEITDDPDFLFVVQDKNPPHLVTVNRIASHHIQLGAQRNRKAIDLYHRCVTNNEWPAYGDQIHSIDLPTYAVYRQEAELTA